MFRRWLNHATLKIAISPRGPILIKSGLATADPTRPGMEFVRTRHALHGETVYLPGTSLKGAMRSQAERVLRGLGIQVCDPFVSDSRCRRGPRPERGRGDRGDRRSPPSSPEIFIAQCPACQTFGSLKVAGRCNVEDAYPWDRDTGAGAEAANATETRWQVGIDRRTGQAQGSGALFDLEVAVAGSFRTTIHLENFALWQLGLLGALIEDMDHGDLPIGFGKTRGLGQVGVKVEGLEIETLGRNGRTLAGAGALCPRGEAEGYGLVPEDAVELPTGVEMEDTWRGRKAALEADEAKAFLAELTTSPLRNWIEAQAASGGRP